MKSNFQDVDYENSWKLYKIVENGVEQPYEDQCTLFYDPNGNYGCYSQTENELVIWGTWTKKKNILYITSPDMNYKQFVHAWSPEEIVISTMERKGRKYFYKK